MLQFKNMIPNTARLWPSHHQTKLPCTSRPA